MYSRNHSVYSPHSTGQSKVLAVAPGTPERASRDGGALQPCHVPLRHQVGDGWAPCELCVYAVFGASTFTIHVQCVFFAGHAQAFSYCSAALLCTVPTVGPHS